MRTDKAMNIEVGNRSLTILMIIQATIPDVWVDTLSKICVAVAVAGARRLEGKSSSLSGHASLDTKARL